MNCPACGSVNDDNARFCESCGAAIVYQCTQCGSPLKPGARFCNQCGAPSPISSSAQPQQQTASPVPPEKLHPGPPQVEGEHKQITILFTDIVGSTPLAEKMDPETWCEIVKGAHQRVSLAVYRYEGTIAQLLGDGVLAFFGAPVTHEDDPLRAVQAALEIQEAVAAYASELRGYVDNFQMRVGLNSGPVVVGPVGNDQHLEYLAVGDAVNLAARLQSAAQPGKVLISESTARQVRAVFELDDLGQIQVKGKADPVQVFQVGRRRVETFLGGRGFEMLDTPLVGREMELESLHQALTGLCSGHGQIVTITGEAGIGKSRLVGELKRLQGRAGTPGGQEIHWVEGRALSYGSALAYWSIIQLIKNDLGLSDGDPELRQRLALRQRIQALFAGQMETAEQTTAYLAHLLGLRQEDQSAIQIQSLNGETLRRQILGALAAYFTCLAKTQPTVAIFEDLHWADPSSLEALERLLAVTDRAPLMLVLLMRQEREHASWRIKQLVETTYPHRYTQVGLKPLSTSEQNRLVDHLLVISALPDPIRNLILGRAEGNPFYLEEIVRSLLEQGALHPDRPAESLVSLDIPETLQGILAARMDHLPDDVRRTLQLASVIGRSFLFRLLQAIAETGQPLEQHLAVLQRVDLVREQSVLPELEYIFKHSLTQEAAYSSLLVEQRRELHRRVGQAIEAQFGERKTEFLGLLAHHFEAAGEKEKALEYLLQAGDQARLNDEFSEATSFYQRAAKLLSSPGDEARQAEVWLKLGLVYNANFHFEQAHTAYERAFELSASREGGSRAQVFQPTGQHTLRFGMFWGPLRLDPGTANDTHTGNFVDQLFVGLTRTDAQANVLPHLAHSWEVLDGGKRYVFHLRHDWHWSDGSLLTARDVEWAWRRNLQPGLSPAAHYLFDVRGARSYHLGETRDPAAIAARAVDDWTFEVCLNDPVAYFTYITNLMVTYPLPSQVVERYGNDWWRPEHILSNGPFRLGSFERGQGLTLLRNPYYPSEFSGNLEKVEVQFVETEAGLLQAYQAGRFDLAGPFPTLPAQKPGLGWKTQTLWQTHAIEINSTLLPCNDVRVRRALALAWDREAFSRISGHSSNRGGLIPPGLPGHTPDLIQDQDLEAARRLLAEAGYPGGQGLPALKVRNSLLTRAAYPGFVHDHYKASLGIDIEQADSLPWAQTHLRIMGWNADYPDPYNFIGDWMMNLIRRSSDWQEPDLYHLVAEAARATQRAQRMELYRQAERYMVVEKVVVVPIDYPRDNQAFLFQPWVKGFQVSTLGEWHLSKVVRTEPTREGPDELLTV